jgi:hypothetical protein
MAVSGRHPGGAAADELEGAKGADHDELERGHVVGSINHFARSNAATRAGGGDGLVSGPGSDKLVALGHKRVRGGGAQRSETPSIA